MRILWALFDWLKRLLPKKQKQELPPMPVFKKLRHKCPFYGFVGLGGIFIDQNGNQCAFIVDSFSPCSMEMNGEIPNWSKCSFNGREGRQIIEKINARCIIFPKEFHPENCPSWEGVPFKYWFSYVMGENTERS